MDSAHRKPDVLQHRPHNITTKPTQIIFRHVRSTQIACWRAPFGYMDCVSVRSAARSSAQCSRGKWAGSGRILVPEALIIPSRSMHRCSRPARGASLHPSRCIDACAATQTHPQGNRRRGTSAGCDPDHTDEGQWKGVCGWCGSQQQAASTSLPRSAAPPTAARPHHHSSSFVPIHTHTQPTQANQPTNNTHRHHLQSLHRVLVRPSGGAMIVSRLARQVSLGKRGGVLATRAYICMLGVGMHVCTSG